MPSLHHEEYLRKRRKKKIIRSVIVVVVFCALVGGLSYLAHRPKFRVARVELSGGVLVTQEEITAAVREQLSGSYLWLFPKNNILLYPRAGLQNYLKKSFQRIDTIHISLKQWNTLSVEITERKPVATWCGSLPSDSETCYFLDSNGTIFAEAPKFSGDAYFKYYGLVATDTPIGQQYLASTTEFSAISDFIASTHTLGFRPVNVIGQAEGEFSLTLSGGGLILFDDKAPMPTIAQNLAALLKTPALSATSPDKLPIDYIDLRFGNKLFYKLK